MNLWWLHWQVTGERKPKLHTSAAIKKPLVHCNTVFVTLKMPGIVNLVYYGDLPLESLKPRPSCGLEIKMKLKTLKRGGNPLKLLKITLKWIKITLKFLEFLLGPLDGIWASASLVHDVHSFCSVVAWIADFTVAEKRELLSADIHLLGVDQIWPALCYSPGQV